MIIIGILVTVQTKPIFFKSFDKEFNPSGDLLGGFLSALNIFAKGLSEDQIKIVIMGKMKYYNYLLNKPADLNLILITDESTSDTDSEKIIPAIKAKFLNKYGLKEITDHMCEPSYFDEFGLSIESYIKKINKVSIDQAADEIADELLIIPLEEKPSLDFINISFPFVFKFIKNDLGKVIYALFLHMPVVITGEPSLVKLIIDTLKLFSPHHRLKALYWTETFNETRADITGVPPQAVGLYMDSTIVDLTAGKVEGLKENKFFDGLVKNIKKLDNSKIVPYVETQINFLTKKIKELVELINSKKVTDTDLNRLNKDLDLDILRILETFFYWNYPKYSKKVKKICDGARALLLAREFIL